MIVTQKASFKRMYKKLLQKEKKLVDTAISELIKNPNLDTLKKGELTGLSVYKFKINKQEKLLAYTFDDNHIVLITLGSHENFYRDLKR